MLGFWGHERIRTAVDGFADHCLAARPRDHLMGAKIKQFTLSFALLAIIPQLQYLHFLFLPLLVGSACLSLNEWTEFLESFDKVYQ